MRPAIERSRKDGTALAAIEQNLRASNDHRIAARCKVYGKWKCFERRIARWPRNDYRRINGRPVIICAEHHDAVHRERIGVALTCDNTVLAACLCKACGRHLIV